MRTKRGVLEGPVIPLPALSDAAAFRMCANGTDLFVSINGGPYVGLGAGTGVPGAPVNSVQFNAAGTFGGSVNFLFDGTSVTLVNVLLADGGVDTTGAAVLALGAANATSVRATPLLEADGGVDRSAAGVLALGAANATSVRVTPTLEADAGIDRSVAGTMTIGAANLTLLELARGGVTVQVNDALTVMEGALLQAAVVLDGVSAPASLSWAERAGDPAAAANIGIMYTKDDAAVTQLFYRDSAGTVHQLTPQPAGAAAGAPTQIQFNTGGVLDASASLTFDGTALAFTGADIDLDPTNDYTLDMDGDGRVIVNLAINTVAPFFCYELNYPGIGFNAIRVLASVGSERVEIGSTSAGNYKVLINVSGARSDAFRVADVGGGGIINADTVGNELSFNNSATNHEAVFLGNADVRFQGGNALTILDRVAPPASFGSRAKLYVQAVGGRSSFRVIDNLGNVTTLTGTPSFEMIDNTATSFLIAEGANEYFKVDTTNTAEVVALGQNANNPSVELATSGGRLGYYGAGGVVRPAAYVVTNPVTRRAYDTTTVTLSELAEVVGTIIADKIANGSFQ